MSDHTQVNRVPSVAVHIRDLTHHFTDEQARTLRDQLNEALGEQVVDDKRGYGAILAVLDAAKAWASAYRNPYIDHAHEIAFRAQCDLDNAVDGAIRAGLL